MNNHEFHTIGIESSLDWQRIRKLLRIGLVASVAHLAADMLLGWGRQDESLSGIMRMFSAYGQLGNGAIYAAAMIGMLSILLEGLSYFGIYRLIVVKSPKYAHHYRTGIFGYLMFCPFGFHVMVCLIIYLYRNGGGEFLDTVIRYYFMPGFILFWIFFAILAVTQIIAFSKRATPYPAWCWIFSIPVGMLAAKAVNVCGNLPIVNAIDCAWISIGNIWMFLGLLLSMKQAADGM